MMNIKDSRFNSVFLDVMNTYTKKDVYLDTNLASLKLTNKDLIEIVVFVNEVLEINLFTKNNVAEMDLSQFDTVGKMILSLN